MQRHESNLSCAITKMGDLFGKLVKMGAKAAVFVVVAGATLLDELIDGSENEGVDFFLMKLSMSIRAFSS